MAMQEEIKMGQAGFLHANMEYANVKATLFKPVQLKNSITTLRGYLLWSASKKIQ